MAKYILLKNGGVLPIPSCFACPIYDKPYCSLLDTSPKCDRETETPDDCPLADAVDILNVTEINKTGERV